jgi:large subunit ribosomal protein L29
MKIYQIREMSTDELKNRILEEQKNLIDLRFQLELKNLANTAKISNTKTDIAKMKTVLKERELQEAKSSKESK